MKKYYIKIIFIILVLLIIAKTLFFYIKNQFTNYLISKDMEVYMYKIFTKKLETLANTELNDEEKIFLKKNLKKIIEKYKFLFEEIKN
jgi:hypothetical protein